MDPTRVKFIHDAPNDRKKALLFEQCRTGQVDVLIGSTSKMGVGTNIQTRAVALHHLDCPWRPADIALDHAAILPWISFASSLRGPGLRRHWDALHMGPLCALLRG